MGSSTLRKRAAKMSPEMRKRQLLEAAISVFADKGIDGAKHADIAKHAGVSVPTTFAYFPTRDELIRAVLDEVAEVIIDTCLRPFLHGGSVRDRLQQTGQALVRLAKSDPDPVKVWVMWTAYFGEPYFELSLAFEKETSGLLCELIMSGASQPPPEDLVERTLLIIGTSRLVAQHAIRQDAEEGLERLINSVTDFALDFSTS